MTHKKIFIASSRESCDQALLVASWLDDEGHKAITWQAPGFFPPGTQSLLHLYERRQEFDAAVFIFSADDQILFRGEKIGQTRANVLMEFGLFVGALGPRKAIICRREGIETSSDLLGISVIPLSPVSKAQQQLLAWARTLDHSHAGLRQTYRSFPLQEFKSMLATASEVRILQTFIPMERHLNEFRSDLKDAIEKRGCQVHILVCHPRSEVVRIRQSALNGTSTDVRKKVENNLREFASLYGELRDDEARKRLKVMTYRTLPSMSIYQADNAFLHGSYYHGMLAISAPQLSIEGHDSLLGEKLMGELLTIWDHRDSIPVPLDAVDAFLQSSCDDEP